MTNTEDLEKRIKQLEKENRILVRKLQRANDSRKELEIAKDLFDGLYQGVISNLKEAQGKIEEESSEREKAFAALNVVLASIDYGIVFMDRDMRAQLINKAFQDMWNIPDALVASNPTMADLIYHNRYSGIYAVADEDFDAYVTDRVEAVRKGTVAPIELVRNDGKTLLYQSIALPDEGRMITYFDISEMKKKESDLRIALDVISGSINYASRIQRSVLPAYDVMDALFSGSFILWEPRDVVGGDVYWVGPWGDGVLILLGDCTGHGVPGAFMTLISIGSLERAMHDISPGNVGGLIQRMHQLIQITLHQHQPGGEADDGIELGACYCVPQDDTLVYAGARFELFAVDETGVDVVKGTKKGIGYRGTPHDQTFENVTIDSVSSRDFYMSTDGLIDQVGGERGRSFGKRRFKHLLTSLRDVPFHDQKVRIREALTNYQGQQARRDDVAVIGFRVDPLKAIHLNPE